MALDKQKILNELRNVMNQLQSGDCGCMGNHVLNPGRQQMGSSNHPIMGCEQNQNWYQNHCCRAPCHMPYTERFKSPISSLPFAQNDRAVNLKSRYSGNTGRNLHNCYGQHSQGIKKFNEMFPSTTRDEELGFDPMAIAIQMNPENQKMVAMNTMLRLMDNNKANTMQPVLAKTNEVKSSYMDEFSEQNQNFKQMIPNNINQNQQQLNLNQIQPQHNIGTSNEQHNVYQNRQQSKTNLQHNLNNSEFKQSQQLIVDQNRLQQNYVPVLNQDQDLNQNLDNVILSNEPTSNPNKSQKYSIPTNQLQNEYIFSAQQSQQQTTSSEPNALMNPPSSYVAPGVTNSQMPRDENAKNVSLSTKGPEKTVNHNIQMHKLSSEIEPAQFTIKEPIFPVETSRNYPKCQKRYQYNTLGQPVELLPVDTYHTPAPNLPQTLSPQPQSKLKITRSKLGVKPTISKTSIVGYKLTGKIPSRNQLQHVYQQYKGSHSYTKQNISPQKNQGGTRSDGKLHTLPVGRRPQNPVSIEKVGGDSAANNQGPCKAQCIVERIDNVPGTNKPFDDTPVEKAATTKLLGCRNGLQDMVYTSYAHHPAWSFHGS